jgi:hypothetical protein
MTADELLTYIFDGRSPALAAEFAVWLTASPRFKAFAELYRDKVRKKIRGIRDEEGLRDLRFELEVAYLLLGEPRFTVEYEKGGVGKQRGPDFCVTYKTRISFNVEVKHIRLAERAGRTEQQEFGKLANIACQKIGQLPPGMINLLVVAYDGGAHDGFDAAAAMTRLRTLAEQKNEDFFARRGFTSTREFFRQYQRLSAALFSGLGAPENGAAGAVWFNVIARHPLPADLRAIVLRLGSTFGEDKLAE